MSASTDDHFRNRLTHTLEVALIGRVLARALRVNEDLTEAIALAHDLGHTPFGHAGEAVLNGLLAEHGGSFEHNRHSRRIVEVLELRSPDCPGLNLTNQVVAGLASHATSYDRPEPNAGTGCLEAQLADLADECAYTTHDLEDALASSYVPLADLTDSTLVARAATALPRGSLPDYPQRLAAKILSMLVSDSQSHTARRLARLQPVSAVALARQGRVAGMSARIAAEHTALKQILFQRYYTSARVREATERNTAVLERIFRALLARPSLIPGDFCRRRSKDGHVQHVTDFVAGMTDEFALRFAEGLPSAPSTQPTAAISQ